MLKPAGAGLMASRRAFRGRYGDDFSGLVIRRNHLRGYIPSGRQGVESPEPVPLPPAFFPTDACMAVAFQLGIDSASPTITYDPFFPDTIAQDATSGWTPYYTNSGFPSVAGLVGDGTSLQISSKNGSFFSITWFGASLPERSFVLDRLTSPHRHWHRSLRECNPRCIPGQFGSQSRWHSFRRCSGRPQLQSPRLLLQPATRRVHCHLNCEHFFFALFVHRVRKRGYHQCCQGDQLG